MILPFKASNSGRYTYCFPSECEIRSDSPCRSTTVPGTISSTSPIPCSFNRGCTIARGDHNQSDARRIRPLIGTPTSGFQLAAAQLLR